MSVHHRLKLIAFPARTGAAEAARPNTRSPRFRHDPFMRDGVFDHGRATEPRDNGPAHVAFGSVNGLGLRMSYLSRLNSPPHTIAVYASRRSSPSAPQHSLLSRRYPLLRLVFHQLDHASFPGALTVYFSPNRLGAHQTGRAGHRVARDRQVAGNVQSDGADFAASRPPSGLRIAWAILRPIGHRLLMKAIAATMSASLSTPSAAGM